MTTQQKTSFWLLGLVVFVLLLMMLGTVLLPFVAGMAVAYFLDPVCDWLETHGFSRTIATTIVTLVFTLISAIFFAISVALVRPIKDLACPAEIFSLSTYEITSFGRSNNLKEFVI